MKELYGLNIAQNVKKYRKIRNFTQQELADKSGISRSYIGDVEISRYNPSIEVLMKISNSLEISINDLIDDEETEIIKIPVLGRIAAGVPLEAITDIIEYEEISDEMAKGGDFFALQIRGASMEPKFSEGDIVIVKKQSTIETGDIAIVFVNDEDATVKKIKKSETGILLIPTNPSYDPNFYTNEEIEEQHVQILGKVVELRAKF